MTDINFATCFSLQKATRRIKMDTSTTVSTPKLIKLGWCGFTRPVSCVLSTYDLTKKVLLALSYKCVERIGGSYVAAALRVVTKPSDPPCIVSGTYGVAFDGSFEAAKKSNQRWAMTRSSLAIVLW